MEDLRWILLGLGALLLLGLYLFSRKRRADIGVPLSEPRQDPLEASAKDHRAEPHIEDIGPWSDEGVGPVRRRPLDGHVATPPRRTAPFSHEMSARPLSDPRPSADATPPVTQSPAAQVSQPDHAHKRSALTVVTLYLIARDPQGFAGSTLIDAFARYGFEFGEMNVYHHSDSGGTILFSLMNGIAPGTFDPATLPKQRTPALALFLRLPIPTQPGLVFDQFLDVAHRLAEELDATLLDERREILSSESIDRMREVALEEYVFRPMP